MQPDLTARPSLARNSTARLGSLMAVLVFGFATSVMTARWLGPSGKGTLSALSFMGDVFFFYICLMGLGEAGIVLVAKKEVTLQRALSASLLPLLATGCVGAVALLIVSIPADWSAILPAVVLQGVVLMLALYMHLFQDLLHSRERFITTSLLSSARVLTTAVMTAVILSFTELGIQGAVTAGLCGVLVHLGGELRALRGMGLSFRPAWDRSYLFLALKLGVLMQAAFLLMAMSQRADQLLVYALAGTRDGGLYAVALTLGILPASVPSALSHASFPRLANLSDEEVWPLTSQIVRVGLIGGGVASIVLAILAPVFTATVFGADYRHSVVPALILMCGGLVWSMQWILARAWAARGRPMLLLISFLCSVVVMLGLDLLLLPLWGLAGAAVASVTGSLGGLVVCVVAYRRSSVGFRAALLVPRVADVKFLLHHGRELIGWS